ncbi:MAG TPA: isochorismatase family protein [Solirubrobacteraceae bacterium]
MSRTTLDPARTALVVIDVQEAFRKAMPAFAQTARQTAVLVRGAHALGLPVIVTEQYPRGLGDTVPEVLETLQGEPRLEKRVFSAARAEGFDLQGRDQALVCGIEAHVCVSQTVLDLLAEGVEVHVAADATASRTEANHAAGLHRVEAAGATLSTVEMALFELVGSAAAPQFKTIQGLIR